MDTVSLLEIARSLTRSQFVERFTHLFFMAAIDGDEVVKYETMVVGANTPRAGAAVPLGVLGTPAAREASRGPLGGLIELSKSPRNPYPERISVGRARNCDVVLRDPSVSKLHAHLRIDGPEPMLIDLDSQNGTRVNAARLEANVPRAIRPGDLVTFGRLTGRIADAATLFDLLR